jgi:hypothetical protein
MNFGDILSKAWQIIWKHKVLWIFGILAGCASGGGNGNGLSYTFGGSDFNDARWRPFNIYFDSFAQVLPWLLLILAIILVLVVLAIFLGTIGRIGLIRGAQQVDQGATQLKFKELFSGSTPFFWRVFALNLLVGLLIALFIFILIFLGVIGTVFTLGIGLLCFLPLLCLLVPLGWLVSLWVEQANIAIVVEDLGIIEGLNKGWDVFKKNLGNILVMGLILLVISLVIGFLLAIPFFVVFTPFLMSFAFGQSSDIWLGFWVSIICLIVFIPILLVLYGILTAYVKTAWTLTYLRLTGRGGAAATAFSPVPPSEDSAPLPPSENEETTLDEGLLSEELPDEGSAPEVLPLPEEPDTSES